MYSIDRRKVALHIYSMLNSFRKTALLVQVCHTTIMRWVNQTEKKQKTPRPKPKSDAILSIIKNYVQLNPFMSTRQMQKTLFDTLNVLVSIELIRVIIKRLGYSRKKAKFISCPKHLPGRTKTFLQKRELFKSQGKKFYSIDETSFGRNGLVTTGYAIKGTRFYVEKKSPTLVSKSVIACATSEGWRKYQIIKGSVTTDTFVNYLKSLDMPENSVLLMDNVSFHHSFKVREFCEAHKIELLFAPPYSPWFNPIELCFSIVKRTFAMFQDINEAFASVTPSHFQRFFEKSLNCTERF